MERLTIRVETGQNRFGNPIKALFNPNQITVDKDVPWVSVPTATRDVPDASFTHGDAATLTLDLFFDTYEDGTSVLRITDRVFHLATVEQHGNVHRPPICQLSWGSGIFFQGVLTHLTQRFTLFLSDGTPVRATLTCTFRQWRSRRDEESLQKLESADVAKQYIVRRSDTLSSIANQLYGNPALWRPIADANRIVNPRVLEPGTALLIPALQPEVPAGGR
jgi:nucleoid-associated protein YgaU